MVTAAQPELAPGLCTVSVEVAGSVVWICFPRVRRRKSGALSSMGTKTETLDSFTKMKRSVGKALSGLDV